MQSIYSINNIQCLLDAKKKKLKTIKQNKILDLTEI